MSEVVIERTFDASPQRVFDALSDNARMGRWLGVRVSVPIPVDGGGVGTVRRIHAGLLHVDEKILAHEAPRRIVYQVVNRLPALRGHRGEVRVEPSPSGGSTVTWRISLEMSIPGAAALLGRVLKKGIGAGLARLSRELR